MEFLLKAFSNEFPLRSLSKLLFKGLSQNSFQIWLKYKYSVLVDSDSNFKILSS